MPIGRPCLKHMLRAVLAVSMLCAVVLGVYIVDNPMVNTALTMMVLAGPLGAIVGTSIVGRRGAICGTLAGIIGSGLAGIIAVSYNWSFPVEDNLLVFGLLASLSTAVLLCWTLKRPSCTLAEHADVRTAARFSLLAVALAIPLSLLRSHLRQIGHSESSDPVWVVDLMEAVVMGLVPLPWMVILRRRATSVASMSFACWDIVAKVLLLTAAILGLVSQGLAAILLFIPLSHGQLGMLGQQILAGLVMAVGLGTAGLCFAVGFVIQLWRDRWHLPLIIVNVLWLVALWAYVLAGMPHP